MVGVNDTECQRVRRMRWMVNENIGVGRERRHQVPGGVVDVQIITQVATFSRGWDKDSEKFTLTMDMLFVLSRMWSYAL